MTGRVLAVVGPTGTGKSALALEVARAFGGEIGCEIVNADSMQLYRGMDVGTAKLRPDERGGIRHHLLDIWDVTETADVARYQLLARVAIDSILAAGRVPILVGGSGLYVRAVLDELDFPGTDPVARQRLEGELAEVGSRVLHARLAELDPMAAAAILPSNGRRVIRALEVVGLRGSFPATLPEHRSHYDALQIGLDRPDLDHRLELRTRTMFDGGLLDEVRELETRGLRRGRTAARALGYAQMLRALDDVRSGADDQAVFARAEQETLQATRRFARRQRSWFRRDPAVRWMHGPAKEAKNRTSESERAYVAKVVTTAQNWWNLSQ